VALLLGVLVAITYGSSDFFGGLAMRQAPVGATLLWTQAIGLVGLLVVALAAGEARPRAISVSAPWPGWLGRGSAASTADCRSAGRAWWPRSAVGAASLQVAWGLVQARISALALCGVVLALVAIGVVAGTAGNDSDRPASRRDEVLLGGAAAILLGVFIIMFSETGSNSGLWPAVCARAAPIPVLLILLPLLRRPVTIGRAALGVVATAGVLARLRTCWLLVALREGPPSSCPGRRATRRPPSCGSC
jgi:hypothetical protein